ncbi:MAG: TonB-dependent receptor [Ponticaulis sp.]|nr:TonB-dependent receptor [Ponticaulis sp.]
MFTRPSSLRWALFAGVSLACMSPVHAQETTQDAPATEELRQQTIQVRGQFIPDEKRSTSEVSSLLDSGDFDLSGDSDAAAALARVAGVSTAQDRFVYVRGLNERYSSATLNGSPLPSPEPLRRVAPLDLFPTSVLKSILVQKTYSPNLPGEFGGGLVDIRTRSVPDAGFFEASVGISGDTETTFKNGLLYDGSDTDWLGYDDGTRDMPLLADTGPDAAFGEALTDDSSLLVIQEGDVSPNGSFGFTGGERFDFSPSLSMGLLGSFSYSNSWSSKSGTRGFADSAGDGLVESFTKTRRSTENKIGVNGYGAMGLSLDTDSSSHEVQFTGLITRSTEKEARSTEGFDFDDNYERDDDIEFFERQLWTAQVSGEHTFDRLMDLKIEWRGSYSEAFRDAPYQFSVLYQDSFDGLGLRTTSNGANTTFGFSRIDDDSTDFGIDASLPIDFGGADCYLFCQTDLKAGYSYVENDRDAVSQLFTIEGVPRSDRRIDYVFASIFGAGQATSTSVGGNTFPERYLATLEVDAAYFQIDTQITPYIRGAIGGRWESAIEAVDTMTLDQDMSLNYVEACIDRQEDLSCDNQEDFLPAVTLTWNPIDDLQVRGGYSETLTRPQFRELAPTEFLNTETDQNFLGNPFLVNAAIKNWDARAEYYFSRDQFVTFGVFYKDMERPIEEISQRQGDTPKTTFINVPSAELYGFEIEYEQSIPLYDWTNVEWFNSKDVTIKANYTWSGSEVTAGRNPNDLGLSSAEFCQQFPGECVITNQQPLNPEAFLLPGAGLIEDGRQLQGQSENLFNFQIGYTDDLANSDFNILFNYASERIRSGEALNLNIPAILEEPPMTVDLVYNKRFNIMGHDYEVSFNLENLLGDDYEAYQARGGDRVDVDTYSIGQSFSIGLKKEW